MGLDMYLNAAKYVGNWDHTPAAEREQAHAIGKLVGIDPLPGNSVEVSIRCAYWRKANAIHKWFVDHCADGVDDCKDYCVSSDQLKALVDLCKTLLANPSGAKEHLPTAEGFFFGSTGYNDDYKADLEETVRQIEPLLTDPRWECFEFSYRASW